VATHDYVISNGSGAAVRSDINDALAAIVSQNSSASAPATTYAYMLWGDTANGLLKQRNAANNAWVTIGALGSTGWGLAPQASPSFTGNAEFTGTGCIDIPSGTTAQRPVSPNSGFIRFNTDLVRYEGYNGTAWVVLDVTLSDSTSSTSSTTAASSAAVKAVQDVAAAALPKVGGTMTGAITFAIGQTFPGAGAATSNYQEFTSNGTWTKPAGVTSMYVEVIGGGSGGGSGARYVTTTGRSGGGAGAGGTMITRYFATSAITSTVAVTVGAGGTGGVAQTVDASNGNSGNAGGISSFGSYLDSQTATGGSGGTTASGTAGTLGYRGVSTVNAGLGSAGGTSAATAGANTINGGAGGSGGVGNTASNTVPRTALAAGFNRTLTTVGTGAIAGANATTDEGGGGGGGSYTTATTGQAGGNGAFPGGGGGGGSASDNGFNSGAGGTGGNGVVRVWSW
jgi:hypothetical protein